MTVRTTGTSRRWRPLILLSLVACLSAVGLGVWLTPTSQRVGATVSVLGASVGAGVAAVAVLTGDRRPRSVDGADAAEEAASAPLLADLVAPVDLTELPALEPGSAGAARFDHLSTVVEQDADAGGAAPVVVAGVAPGELAVWVGANLAIALAGSGRRVLLVDGRMGERFGRPVEDGPDTPGLREVLLGVRLEDAVSPGPVAGMDVLPSGRAGREPTLDLIARGFAGVVEEAASRYDHVLVLGPPLQVCDDARAMALGGALVLTLARAQVRAAVLATHADRVREAGTRLLGLVLVSDHGQGSAS